MRIQFHNEEVREMAQRDLPVDEFVGSTFVIRSTPLAQKCGFRDLAAMTLLLQTIPANW